ncbi:MAG TPA: hypothetical protein VHL53_02160 [Acidimicrobiia bacterium]|nr:hypothetical protein [Acidimicrobiia bacterium]
MGGWLSENRRSFLGLLAANLAALALMSAGWFFSASTRQVGTAMAWTNVALVGLVVAVVGDARSLLASRQSVRQLARAVIPLVDGAGAAAPGPAVVDLADDRAVASWAEPFVAAAGMTRYHDPSCVLATGKTVAAAGRADHERAGRVPCEVCQP